MTVKLTCGRYEVKDLGGYYEIEADFVREEELIVEGRRADFGINEVAAAISKLKVKDIIKILKESDIDPDDLVDVDCDPSVSWMW